MKRDAFPAFGYCSSRVGSVPTDWLAARCWSGCYRCCGDISSASLFGLYWSSLCFRTPVEAEWWSGIWGVLPGHLLLGRFCGFELVSVVGYIQGVWVFSYSVVRYEALP